MGAGSRQVPLEQGQVPRDPGLAAAVCGPALTTPAFKRGLSTRATSLAQTTDATARPIRRSGIRHLSITAANYESQSYALAVTGEAWCLSPGRPTIPRRSCPGWAWTDSSTPSYSSPVQIRIIDAFADRPFVGNPETPAPDGLAQAPWRQAPCGAP
jgi:hypothetical protein